MTSVFLNTDSMCEIINIEPMGCWLLLLTAFIMWVSELLADMIECIWFPCVLNLPAENIIIYELRVFLSSLNKEGWKATHLVWCISKSKKKTKQVIFYVLSLMRNSYTYSIFRLNHLYDIDIMHYCIIYACWAHKHIYKLRLN